MYFELRRTACAAAAVSALLLAGCSGAGTPPSPAANASAPNGSASQSRAMMRFGSTVVHGLMHFGGAPERAFLSPEAKAGKNLLYVSSYNEGYVKIYSTKGTNQAPIGTITSGLNGPEGMAVDRNLNLYVTNTGNNTITVYAPGQTTPSATYSQGLNEPAGVAVGDDGTVYGANLAGTVVEYAKGSMSPERTLQVGDLPIDVTLDKANNLYVTYGDGVEEFAPGSTTGTNLGIRIDSPGGVQIDKSGNIVVANQTLPGVEVFAQGSTSPSQTFAQTGDPNPIRFDKKAKNLYVGDPLSNIVDVYAYPSGTLANTISNGVNFDAGVAVSAESKY
jgi:hypothetical protein